MPCPALPELPAAARHLRWFKMLHKMLQVTASTTGCRNQRRTQPVCMEQVGGPQPLQQLHQEESQGLAFACLADGAILIQDAEDIIDLNKLSVKEKL